MKKHEILGTQQAHQQEVQKQVWQSMKVDYVGNVSELVLGGSGKLSNPSGDPGDLRKVATAG